MGEFGYMEDADYDLEWAVCSQYLNRFGKETPEMEKIETLAKDFNLSKRLIVTILIFNSFLKPNSEKIEQELTMTDYLKTLSQKQLDSFYAVLASQGKTGRNGEIMTIIEEIILERLEENEELSDFEKIGNEFIKFSNKAEITKWNSFELDFSINFENKDKVINKIKSSITNHKKTIGLYSIYKDEKCLYIGIGRPIWQRIKSHYYASKSKINPKNSKWISFFSKYQTKLKIYWTEFEGIDNPKQSRKIREVVEDILQNKYKPEFEKL